MIDFILQTYLQSAETLEFGMNPIIRNGHHKMSEA